MFKSQYRDIEDAEKTQTELLERKTTRLDLKNTMGGINTDQRTSQKISEFLRHSNRNDLK